MAELTEAQKAAAAVEAEAKKAADAIEAELKKESKYRVLRPLSHNQKTYPVEGVVVLSGKDALSLVADRTVEPATKEVPL